MDLKAQSLEMMPVFVISSYFLNRFEQTPPAAARVGSVLDCVACAAGCNDLARGSGISLSPAWWGDGCSVCLRLDHGRTGLCESLCGTIQPFGDRMLTNELALHSGSAPCADADISPCSEPQKTTTRSLQWLCFIIIDHRRV